jgi:hypothetical protein
LRKHLCNEVRRIGIFLNRVSYPTHYLLELRIVKQRRAKMVHKQTLHQGPAKLAFVNAISREA